MMIEENKNKNKFLVNLLFLSVVEIIAGFSVDLGVPFIKVAERNTVLLCN